MILIATGSELQIALAARDILQDEGIPTRVVSMPCVEWFTGQDASYQEEVLPPHIRARVSVEAGVAQPWHAFTGDFGECVSLEHFGASASYMKLYEEFGFTAEHVAAAARSSLARLSAAADATREARIHDLPAATPQTHPAPAHPILGELTAAGVSIWLDDISRERLRTGNLAELIRDWDVTGVTSNPTIFAHAVANGDAYDQQLKDLAIRGVQTEEAARVIATYDIRWGCDVLRPVYDATDGVDGRVSIEVDPRIAKDTAKTIAEARALWWMVDRPNLFIKIPATLEGLPAITASPGRGDQRERDADLLPGAVRPGHRRVHDRPGAGARGGP